MTLELTSDFPAHSLCGPIVQLKQGVSEMYTMSVLCIVLCTLCMPFLVFGQKKACKDGFYQFPSCTTACGNCKTTWCEVNEGICRTGCKDGYFGEKCVDSCKPGFYGSGCSQKCDGCMEGCNSDGTCKNNVCKYGFYKLPMCSLRCEQCNTPKCGEDGICPTGCAHGWKGDKCTEKCDLLKYGVGCTAKCGVCAGGNCAPNGSCTTGCEQGWMGDKCIQACEDGNYGAGCTLKCGECNRESCGPSGTCISGCKPGWEGDDCKTASVIETSASTESMNLRIVFGILAIILALLAILLFIFGQTSEKTEEEEPLNKEPDTEGQQDEIPPEEGAEPPEEGAEPLEEGAEPPEEGAEPQETPENGEVEEGEVVPDEVVSDAC